MNRLSRAWKLFLAVCVLLVSAVPGLAVAQDTLNPDDPNVQELLTFLEIDLQPTDPVWQDQDFVTFVQSYQTIAETGEEFRNLMKKMFDASFTMAESMIEIDDARFREAFGLPNEITEEELEEARRILQDERDSLDEILTLIDEEELFNPEELLGTFGFLGNLGYEEEYTYDDFEPIDGLFVYAWSDPSDAVEAGNIVSLLSEIEGANPDDVSVTWTQIYGPEVTTWLKTDSKFHSAFIVPQYDVLGDETYMEFEVAVEANGETDYTYVYVDLIMG